MSATETSGARDHQGLEILEVEECYTLLGATAIGRLGVEATGRPRIFPVNYVMHDGAIVFRTNPGTKLSDARAARFVAFEIDGFDVVTHTGWSVLVSGIAERVVDDVEVDVLETLPLRPWGPGRKQAFVRIRPVQISGRRIPDLPRDLSW